MPKELRKLCRNVSPRVVDKFCRFPQAGLVHAEQIPKQFIKSLIRLMSGLLALGPLYVAVVDALRLKDALCKEPNDAAGVEGEAMRSSDSPILCVSGYGPRLDLLSSRSPFDRVLQSNRYQPQHVAIKLLLECLDS